MSVVAATGRQQAIDACADECMHRVGAILMRIIDRAHVMLGAIRGELHEGRMLERKEHLPECRAACKLTVEAVIEELGIDFLAERYAGNWDAEQFSHDVRVKLLIDLKRLM